MNTKPACINIEILLAEEELIEMNAQLKALEALKDKTATRLASLREAKMILSQIGREDLLEA